MKNCENRESYSMYLSISVWERKREKEDDLQHNDKYEWNSDMVKGSCSDLQN